jgi:hypothetical protein
MVSPKGLFGQAGIVVAGRKKKLLSAEELCHPQGCYRKIVGWMKRSASTDYRIACALQGIRGQVPTGIQLIFTPVSSFPWKRESSV